MSELQRSKELLELYKKEMEKTRADITNNLFVVTYLKKLIGLYDTQLDLNNKIFNLTHDIEDEEEESK